MGLSVALSGPPDLPGGGWRHERYGDAAVSAHYRQDGGRAVIVAIVIQGSDLTATTLRAVPIGELLRTGPAGEPIESGAPAPFTRKGSGGEFLAKVQEAYVYYVQRTGKPAVEIAALCDVPVGTVRRWVREARGAGLIGPGHQGRSG